MSSQKIKLSLTGLVASCTFWVSGCSKTEWIVQWSDTFLAWKINEQFEFEGEAKKKVKEQTTLLIQDLRRKQFAKIAAFFRMSADEITNLNFQQETAVRTWVDSKMKTSEVFFNSLPQELEPHATAIAGLIDKNHWQIFLQNFEKENKRILKSGSKCSDKMTEQMEDWLGSLNDSQEESLKRFCSTRKDSQEVRVRNRQHLLKNFRQNLESPSSDWNSAHLQKTVQKWLHSYPELQLPEAREKWKNSREELIQSFTQILMKSSPKQREHFQNQLRNRAQSLQKLAL